MSNWTYTSQFNEDSSVPLQEATTTSVLGRPLRICAASGVSRWGRADPFEYFDRLRRVRRHADDHLQEALSLEKMARVACMAPSSFRRYFRERVGMTYRQWLVAHRIEVACKKLTSRNMSSNEISEEVGFGSVPDVPQSVQKAHGQKPDAVSKGVPPATAWARHVRISLIRYGVRPVRACQPHTLLARQSVGRFQRWQPRIRG